jgi:hypothetical protein
MSNEILNKIAGVLEEGKVVKLSSDGDISVKKAIANHITIRDDSVGAIISINKKYLKDLVDFIQKEF